MIIGIKSRILLISLSLIKVIATGCKNIDDHSETSFICFLSSEIVSLGGKPLLTDTDEFIDGNWSVRRDDFGSAIDVKNLRFSSLTNLLTTVYGNPELYSPANERHDETYLYHFSQAGVSIFVSATDDGAEVTLTKPLSFQ